jgi:enoyl-CoA hydratase/carnithine racemase
VGFTGPAGRLCRFVSMGQAKDILLTGRAVKADEALAMGLVTAVVEDDAVEGAAEALARRIARVPAGALASTKAHIADMYRGAGVPEQEMAAGAIRAFASPELQAILQSMAPPSGPPSA